MKSQTTVRKFLSFIDKLLFFIALILIYFALASVHSWALFLIGLLMLIMLFVQVL